ncbi:TRAP-type mannitol/chloroaromatic compound transport system, small permease component [Pseudooceanicola antarcticus]|uniref:TRAP transporter small permease protein n=1 Tax=Pseudooceanicola antarcticus TaxID=1247613 RepID=A0A285JET5_9RHOB|nr:TRAP transporter small permease [Pseudooceanicola antarcticus]PJE31052.1 TRAP transporter small permease [Pseudooceanicola antarcticus]SNY58799.1 TRAP-type mannitol/chloroaromatic compound transport system, small permease component [Pseudooceanicola antarcticus]
MAGHSSVLTDGGRLSQIDRGLYRVERFMALLSGIAVFSLMVLAVVSVGGRNLFNAPLPGYVDWIQQLMPLIAFMGVSFTQRDGGHIRMDILVGRLKGRALWGAEFITTAFMLVLIVLLIWGSWAHFERSFDFTRPLWSRDSSIDIALPLWPAKLLAPVAFSVLALRLVLQLWGYARAFAQNLAEPVAVPLVRSAAELAAEEAELVSGGKE